MVAPTELQSIPSAASADSPPPPISAAQIEQFHRDGWCVVDALFSPAEIDAIEAFFEEFKTNGAAIYDGESRFEDIDPAKRQLRAMHPHRHSEQAKTWALQPRVLAVLGALLGHPALLAQTMYYFKPPGAKGQGMHQDNFYLLAAPATCIAAWTAIDAATLDNGCLWVVPGSHRHAIHCPKEVPGENWNNYGDSHINPFPRDAKPIPVTVPRGSTMFFGGQLIHGSGPNRTATTSRRTFIGHYVDAATTSLSKFYHPVLDARGQVVSTVAVHTGGGPCGDGTGGGVH
ncbi:MAG: phytanoyl-CoA dioxygenase family protein [Opitutaceae bacterium]|jgi:ectoine hydroxylase-related dioxygenase (phytanoyl-CoA dioxygenase family)|nr:phytanoyl-CoA dioxygenase family protein [Opitutaceae bacterium]